MDLWERIKWVVDWTGRIWTLVQLLIAIGGGATVKALLSAHVPQIWLTPIWLFSSATILAAMAWVIPRVLRRSQTSDENWAEKMETEDAKFINQRIIVVNCEPQLHLAANEPYIDFKFTFVNATIFHLASEKIEGPAYYGRDPIAQHPTIVEPPFTMRHGDKKWVIIRQHLSRELARKLLEARGHVKLDFSRVCIKFLVLSPGTHPQQPFFWFGSEDVEVANRD
jgi:hypothetical protein